MFLKKARSLRKYPNKKAESIIDNDYRMKMPKTKYDGKNSQGSIYEVKSNIITRKKFVREQNELKSYYFHLVSDQLKKQYPKFKIR